MQYLYLILCKDSSPRPFYKIGIANDVDSRLAQLQTGSPHELEIVDCFGFVNAELVERAIHQAFSKERVRGEWFELNSVQAEDEFRRICELLRGEPYVWEKEVPTEEEIQEAEEAQETQDILLSGIDWRLDRRNGRGYAIFKRGGEKEYLGYVGKQNLKDLEHPTVEEIESAIARGRAERDQNDSL